MKKTICTIFCALCVIVLMTGLVFSADMKQAAEQEQTVMITGTINDANQLVDNTGQIFEIADTEAGNELLTHIGQKVQIKGTVMEDESKKELSISSYEIIKE